MNEIKLRNIPSGRDGNAYITINGQVMPAFKIAKCTPQIEMITEAGGFLETLVEQNTVRGMKIHFDLDYYNLSSAMLEAVRDYKNGGDYPDISLQYYTTSKQYGRQEVLLTGVILNSISMGMLDDSSTSKQTHSTSGTADNFDIISSFKEA